jgi:hypothetical protein
MKFESGCTLVFSLTKWGLDILQTVLALTKKNSNATTILLFLHKLAEVTIKHESSSHARGHSR